MSAVEATILAWRQRTANLRCQEICDGLAHLGFKIRNRRAGHKIVSHARLPHWFGTDFDGGHGQNNTVKPAYVRKLIRILTQLKDEFELL